MLASIPCERCKTPFRPRRRDSRFCSKSCASRTSREIASREGRIHGRQKSGEVVACKQCGKEIYRKQFQIKGGTGFLCGTKCHRDWQARNAVTKPCEWCGKIMERISPDRATRQRFCSFECQREGRSVTAIDRWHNGRRVRMTDDGYLRVYQPDHPDAYKDGWIPEHRYIASNMIGRRLSPDEHVHHVNGIRDDNREANLMVVSSSEHQLLTRDEILRRRKENANKLAEYERRFGPLT